MRKVLKIVKINILAMIALPLLLLATALKLAAKAMEKAVTVIGTVFILFGVAIIFHLFKNPSEWLNGIFTVIMCLVLGGIFTVIAIWILGLISGAIAAAVALIIALLNGTYELVYAGYAGLYQSCKTEYTLISQEGSRFINGLSCLIFTLLKVVNRVIILFVTHAIKIFVLACIAIVIGSLIQCSQYIQSQFGIDLLTYVKLFPTYSIVYGVTMYLLVMGACVIILLSLGVEWSDWGSEMEVSTSDYENYLSSIVEGSGEFGQESIQGVQDLDAKRLEKCNRYQEILHRHAMEIEEFAERIHPFVDKSDNYILRSGWGEYFSKLEEVVNRIDKYEGGIPVEEFEKLMPQIDRLEKLKQTIEKQALKAAAEQKAGAAAGGGFFAGCDTPEKLEKRYRALCKTYHPDFESGDEDTFKVMTEEYEKLKEKL